MEVLNFQCSACGSFCIGSVYFEANESNTELLEITCGRCGYKWNEVPLFKRQVAEEQESK